MDVHFHLDYPAIGSDGWPGGRPLHPAVWVRIAISPSGRPLQPLIKVADGMAESTMPFATLTSSWSGRRPSAPRPLGGAADLQSE
jgi:hypothetical protein